MSIVFHRIFRIWSPLVSKLNSSNRKQLPKSRLDLKDLIEDVVLNFLEKKSTVSFNCKLLI